MNNLIQKQHDLLTPVWFEAGALQSFALTTAESPWILVGAIFAAFFILGVLAFTGALILCQIRHSQRTTDRLVDHLLGLDKAVSSAPAPVVQAGKSAGAGMVEENKAVVTEDEQPPVHEKARVNGKASAEEVMDAVNALPASPLPVVVCRPECNPGQGASSQQHWKGLPRVVFAQGLLEEICDYLTAFLRENGEANEAGGVLIGKRKQVHAEGEYFEICGFIDAGPHASFSSGHIDIDHRHHLNQMRAYTLSDPDLTRCGFIHRHPGRLTTNSSVDVEADRKAVEGHPAQGGVFVIVTIDEGGREPGFRIGRYVMNFYYLGHLTRFNYAEIEPQFAKVALARFSHVERFFARYRGLIGCRDFVFLQDRELRRGWPLKMLPMRYSDGRDALRIEGQLVAANLYFRIDVEATGSMRVETRDSDKADFESVAGPWEDAQIGRLLPVFAVLVELQRQCEEKHLRDSSEPFSIPPGRHLSEAYS